jgi:hypothetical protein
MCSSEQSVCINHSVRINTDSVSINTVPSATIVMEWFGLQYDMLEMQKCTMQNTERRAWHAWLFHKTKQLII